MHNQAGSWYGAAGVITTRIGGSNYSLLYSGSNGASKNVVDVKDGKSSYGSMSSSKKTSTSSDFGDYRFEIRISGDISSTCSIKVSYTEKGKASKGPATK